MAKFAYRMQSILDIKEKMEGQAKIASQLIIAEFDERLKKTIRHRDLSKNTSYQYLIRLECYKLIKHLIEEKSYDPFVIWW